MSEVVAADGGRADESVRAVNEATQTGTPGADTTTANTTTANTTTADTTGPYMIVDDPKPPDPTREQHEEHRLHAVPQHPHAMPVPTRWRSGDKRLRHDRGMLAAGTIFTAICGVGAGLSIWAFFDPRSRSSYYGSDSRDSVAVVTGLLTCTVGAVALAAVGAARLKKRRGR